ncbi:MAG: peptidoglycan DD-metalloendopeptidase family protein [Bryobacterales bacterium]|nr:peptidoglycan DD-metalloendopeptidase family protein [Bryobacterales bacterium]
MELKPSRVLKAAAAIGVSAAGCAVWFIARTPVAGPAATIEAAPAAVPEPVTESLAIRAGETLEALLRRAGIEQGILAPIAAAIEGAFSARRFRAGSELAVTRSSAGAFQMLEYLIDPDHSLQVRRGAGGFRAAVVDVPGAVREAPVCGTLSSSLFESMERAGERPELALRVADIFGWQLDFYTDPQEGDRFCVAVEKKEYENGQPAAYQRILAATYENAGKVYDAFLFSDGGGKPLYYSSDGKSLQSPFLRSPMKFEARISSRFSRARRHPVLKIVRPHLGTDYAAPSGTPVQAVGSGTVAFAGNSGQSGNMVRLRHANGYETSYLHLSRILVRQGMRVEQGERIGLVGATGLATGPHLDFRMNRGGRYVDFERLKLPPATTLSAAQMEAFQGERRRLLALMQTAGPDAALVASSRPAAREREESGPRAR